VKVGLSDTTSHDNRPGERKARLLLEVLRDRQADVLRFAHDLRVPATSNQAERDLRPGKIQQKISARFASEARTKDRFRIRGYLSTAAKHGRNMIYALRGDPRPPLDTTRPQPSLTHRVDTRTARQDRPGGTTPCHHATKPHVTTEVESARAATSLGSSHGHGARAWT
jgi:hypothetical protein